MLNQSVAYGFFVHLSLANVGEGCSPQLDVPVARSATGTLFSSSALFIGVFYADALFHGANKLVYLWKC